MGRVCDRDRTTWVQSHWQMGPPSLPPYLEQSVACKSKPVSFNAVHTKRKIALACDLERPLQIDPR